jgi:phospholipid/cholesterol/gamma-HCH transport system permease protein
VVDRESRFEQRHSLIELRAPPASGQAKELALEGKLVFTEAASLWKSLTARLEALDRGETLNFDMSGLEAIDGGTMALLAHLRAELKLRGVACEFVGVRDELTSIVHLYHGDDKPVRRRKRKAESSLSHIGRATIEFLREAQNVFGFLGDMLLAVVGLLKEPHTANWREVPHIMERTGADAIPIVALINFLVGFVMAFQGAVQLKQFGANVFVADLVGLSVTRELGPLMTAIILCGRTGAAFAAELGSMQVSEEIDALRTLGFGPIRYLVLPRALGLMLVAPFLTLLADAVGIAGGLVVAISSLDLTIGSYFNETRQALDVWDVFSGVLKSVVFALAIALVSCQQGFAAQGGAEGVGRRTTSSVVTILFSLILIDAGFTGRFYEFGL